MYLHSSKVPRFVTSLRDEDNAVTWHVYISIKTKFEPILYNQNINSNPEEDAFNLKRFKCQEFGNTKQVKFRSWTKKRYTLGFFSSAKILWYACPDIYTMQLEPIPYRYFCWTFCQFCLSRVTRSTLRKISLCNASQKARYNTRKDSKCQRKWERKAKSFF